MGKIKAIKKVLVLGSGALKIGEAGEFDYSGTQALKALKEENIKTVLINPNIATVQTSKDIANKIYLLPITPHFVEQVIIKEKPDSILIAFGGQTALNCGIELHKKGIFDKYKVQVLGTQIDSIIATEDRKLFAYAMQSIDVEVPKSVSVASVEHALDVCDSGFPIMVRLGYALGGLGSGFASDKKELKEVVSKALLHTKEVLVEESLKGWKEIEYEIVRDSNDNCIAVCNMENFDPLGIHTGESIVVAPSQTLTNEEYFKLRSIAIKIARHFNVVGECNVQFALDPTSSRYKVIEINARLSRSSALASKATGYPLAYVAAKLSLGYTLAEIKNPITKTTTLFAEPSLDYVVVKIPKWDIDKFKGVDRKIGSSMKSIGEVMAIGKTFEEAIQKGLRMVDHSIDGFTETDKKLSFNIIKNLINPTDERIFYIYEAFKNLMTVEQVCDFTKIDEWFISRLYNIYKIEQLLKVIKIIGGIEKLTKSHIKQAKLNGFSDIQICKCIFGNSNKENVKKIREYRISKNIVPYIKQIDTVSGEYPANTNYCYWTYHGAAHDLQPKHEKSNSVIVLGSGPYKIGSSVEFDWCCVNTVKYVKNLRFETVMVNCNPETVSTDYDICDTLYFDELTLERILDIADFEKPYGIIVSMGGQIPNNLALDLHNNGVNIIGTSPESIDIAENREKFSKLCDKLNISQPKWKKIDCYTDIASFCKENEYPFIIRPSYVLSGARMSVVSNEIELTNYLKKYPVISQEFPVVVSKFMENAQEAEVDAVAKEGILVACAISEHVENAGVHSGDATLIFPSQNITKEIVNKIKLITRKLAKTLSINGIFNIQFLVKDKNVQVIECNLRASRSIPFISKVSKFDFIQCAASSMFNLSIPTYKNSFKLKHVGVKAPQFSFTRLHGSDCVLGVDMLSTGEVGCIGSSIDDALLKSMLSVGYKTPSKGVLLSTGDSVSKNEMLNVCRLLYDKGIKLFATYGTYEFLLSTGIESTLVYWPNDARQPNVKDHIINKDVDLVINIPKSLDREELSNDYIIRSEAIKNNIPVISNTKLAIAFIKACCVVSVDELCIKSLDEY